MKKLIILLALVMAVAFATGACAEVQNVKVGGDIRIRANWSENVGNLDSDIDVDEVGFIQQRTRVIVEADLTDNVAVAAVIEAEGYWGDVYNVAGLGVDIRREWDAGFSEAWVQLSELYYTPLTVKLGRQYLHYGTGFIISSAEYENNFDAVRSILDFNPWTIELVYAKTAETLVESDDIDLYGGNIKYQADTWTIEGYVWGQTDKASTLDIEPIVFGLRGDVTPLENLDIWGEISYETGDIMDQDLSALAADLGLTYTFADITWRPTVGLAYTYGEGDSTDLGDNFFEFFEYDYYGYCYSPKVSNIHIINANVMIEPIEKLALILDYYHYIQDEDIAMVMGDLSQDNGGVAATTNGTDSTLGDELDVIAEYDYTEDVSTQLYLAWFFPGDAYSSPADDDAYEIRGEIVVSF